MPGLKQKQQQGINNINEMMRLRTSTDSTGEISVDDTPVMTQEGVRPEEAKIVATTKGATIVYERQRKSNGRYLRKKYDAGKPPRAHMELYAEIVSALNGQKRGIVLLKPILEKLEMNYVTSAKIFSLLEEYGYLAFERAPNRQGKLLVIEVLRSI